MHTKNYFIYIATNKTNTVLYTGVTNNDVTDAIKQEKQIKAGYRKKKLELIKKMNPTFENLYRSII